MTRLLWVGVWAVMQSCRRRHATAMRSRHAAHAALSSRIGRADLLKAILTPPSPCDEMTAQGVDQADHG